MTHLDKTGHDIQDMIEQRMARNSIKKDKTGLGIIRQNRTRQNMA